MTTENNEILQDPKGIELTEEVEKMIRRYAAITAAMELLPDAVASIGILPLQARLVYLVGQKHGFSLDSRHALEFAAVFGIGAVAQRAEAVVRKFIHADGVAGVAAASASTFGITYALGKVADHYYSHGRKFSMDELRKSFSEYKDQAKGIYEITKQEVAELGRSGNPAAAAGE